MSTDSIRLSSMAHGGGCGCKLSPAVLATLIGNTSAAQSFKQLLVGTETGDDAAVWQLDERTCLISTTDFFTPMVDDPRDFGRIAATNAISDIYAMGGRPIFALAILGMPLGKLAPERVREILEGGREVCQSAGIPVAGGHSIDTPEPIYGLAVNGICAPSELRRNCDAKPGDLIILTKPVGVGIYSAAFKKEALPRADYADMLATMTTLNQIGAELAQDPAVHAMTDVTGFGVLGHALGMARGSGLRFILRSESVPLLPRAIELAQQGFVTGA
jgi:selenide, water dikinase